MDVNDMEGGVRPGGAQGSPNPDASGGQAAVPSPVTAPELETVLKVVKDLEAQVRSLQSGKDKGMAAVQREIKELKASKEQFDRYAKLLQNGAEPDEAYQSVRREVMVERLLAKLEAEEGEAGVPRQDGAGTPSPQAGQAADVDPSVFGLDPNAPEVVELYRRGEVSLSALYTLAQKAKARQEVQPNPGAVLPVGGGIAPPSKDFTEDYRKEMYAARGQGPHVGRQIKEKYRQKGVDVDNLPLA